VSADLSGVALAKTEAIRAKGEAKDAIFTLRSQSVAKDGPPCGIRLRAASARQEPQGFLAKKGEETIRRKTQK